MSPPTPNLKTESIFTDFTDLQVLMKVNFSYLGI